MKKISIIFLTIFLLVSSLVGEVSVVNASQTQTVVEYQKELSKDMLWEDPKWVTYPDSQYGTYPSTYEYDKNGYTGTLQAKRIKLVPKEKVYHKDPVYKTESRTFTKNTANNYSTNSNTNVPSTYTINEDGYSGTIPRTSLSWESNWVRNRTHSLTRNWTDSLYRKFTSEVPAPARYTGTYYDSPSGENVNYSLPKSGGLVSVASKKGWITYRSRGRAENYDKFDNYFLGFMSQSSTTYYAGRWSDPKPGEAPDRYYGIPRSYLGMGDWKLVAYGWDESSVVNADTWASKGNASKLVYDSGSYWWRSESGRLNKYRKGVWIDYQLYVPLNQYRQTYSGSFALPDYIKDYTANATYSGTLSKQVLSHYNEYYTSSKWDVYIEYIGTTYETNLTAIDIKILDSQNNPVTTLVKGIQYKARFTYKNSGELTANSHKIALYENGILLRENDAGSIMSGASRTVDFTFVANNTGSRIFQAKVDSTNVIKETNENDNAVSVTKTVNEVNLRANSIVITDMSNNATTSLVQGIRYKANITYTNTGQISVPTHYVNVQDNGVQIGEISASSLANGGSRTVTIEFVANNTGNRTFKSKVDSRDQIIESNENDNEVSVIKTVNYVNLKIQKLEFVDENNVLQSHLVKGRNYKAKITYLNESQIAVPVHKVSLSEENVLLKEITSTSIPLGQTKIVYIDFTAKTSATIKNFKAFVDSANEIIETIETDNKLTTGILVNTIPEISLQYSPNPVHEGDNVTLTMLPKDDDNNKMSVELKMKKGNDQPVTIYNQNNVFNGDILKHVVENIKVDNYSFTVTVTDEHGESSSATVSFKVIPLTIDGFVDHTPDWKVRHEELENEPHEFYSGEKFLTSAIVTDHPIEKVTVHFRGLQVDNEELNITKTLNSSHPLYTSEVYDVSMSDVRTKLANGSAYFVFTAEWKNGVIKQDIVTVRIIDDVYGAFDFHRSN